jgi:hypothetical protein
MSTSGRVGKPLSHVVQVQFVAHKQSRRKASSSPHATARHSLPSSAQGVSRLMSAHSGSVLTGRPAAPALAPPLPAAQPVGAAPPVAGVGVVPEAPPVVAEPPLALVPLAPDVAPPSFDPERELDCPPQLASARVTNTATRPGRPMTRV